jgi:hypothetical protein
MPVPDGSCDITSHVMFDSLIAPGDVVMSQRDVLRLLGIDGERPPYDGDSRAYLAGLAAVSEASDLLDPRGFGGFSWLILSTDVNAACVPRVSRT